MTLIRLLILHVIATLCNHKLSKNSIRNITLYAMADPENPLTVLRKRVYHFFLASVCLLFSSVND